MGVFAFGYTKHAECKAYVGTEWFLSVAGKKLQIETNVVSQILAKMGLIVGSDILIYFRHTYFQPIKDRFVELRLLPSAEQSAFLTDIGITEDFTELCQAFSLWFD